MPRDRFLLILRFLHFNDNDSYAERDRLHMSMTIPGRAQTVYSPGRDLCVDESFVLFKAIRLNQTSPFRVEFV